MHARRRKVTSIVCWGRVVLTQIARITLIYADFFKGVFEKSALICEISEICVRKSLMNNRG